jgi:uncharacterized membrane protein
MHLVSVVVWLGGLIFMNAMMSPVVEYHRAERSLVILDIQRRFLPFIWSSLWSLAVTGIILMLLSPRFLWFEYSTAWSQLLAAKQLVFLLWIFASWQTVKVFGRLRESEEGDSDVFEGWHLAFTKLLRRGIVLGLLGVAFASAMLVI